MFIYRISKPLHAIHRNILFASLNLTDVGPVQNCFSANTLQEQVQLLARKPKPCAKANFGGLSLERIEGLVCADQKLQIFMTLDLQRLSSYARIFPLDNITAGSDCVMNEI